MARGKLTTIMICIVMVSVAYMSMWMFYAGIVVEYSSVLNFTTDSSFDSTYVKMNESLGIVGGDMTVMHQEYLNESPGTQLTASDTMIVRSFKMIKNIMKTANHLIAEVIPDVATKLKIPRFWVDAFVTIVLIIILIVVIAGFFKITTW